MGASFELLGTRVEYPEGFEKIAGELGAFVACATETCGAFFEMYRNGNNINEVLYYTQSRAASLTSDMVQRAIAVLGASGVTMTDREFTEQYGIPLQFDYNTWIAPTINAKDQILTNYNQRMMMKGMPANDQLDSEARSQLSALYKDERTCAILTDGIRQSILNIFMAVIKVLKDQEKLDDTVALSREKAAELYAQSFSGGGVNAEQIIQAIFAFPGEKQYYDSIFWQLVAEEGDAFERFLAFWGLSAFYPGLSEKRTAAKAFDRQIAESSLASFDYNNPSAENYAYLRSTLTELSLADTAFYPELSASAGYIKTYYNNICVNEGLFMDPRYVSFLKRGASLEEFVAAVRMERDALPINPYRSLWIYNDMAGDKIPLSPKQGQLQAVAYEGDCIVFNCPQGLLGNKGIAVTMRYIVDFAKNIRIPLANVTDIAYNGNDSIRIMGDQGYFIDMGKLSAPYINAKLLPNPQMKDGLVRSLSIAFLNLLKLYCIRYGGNQYLLQYNPYLA